MSKKSGVCTFDFYVCVGMGSVEWKWVFFGIIVLYFFAFLQYCKFFSDPFPRDRYGHGATPRSKETIRHSIFRIYFPLDTPAKPSPSG